MESVVAVFSVSATTPLTSPKTLISSRLFQIRWNQVRISSGSVDFLSVSCSNKSFRERPTRWHQLACVSNSEDSASSGGESEDVITLDVKGMMCEGCTSSVKRILESQPQVSFASVDLATETAYIQTVPEAKVTPNWQQQLGENLAKLLTNCGFNSSPRGSPS